MIKSTDVFCVGMNHRTAPVDVRERLALSNTRQQSLLAHMRKTGSIEGFVFVGTCNRVEFYASMEEPWAADGFGRMREHLADAGCPVDAFDGHLYAHRGIDAAWHLARVAAGLDAVILGESEILGQLDRALVQADELGTTDPHVETLFRFALRAGRRARDETVIGRNPVSVGSVAIRLAERELGSLRGRTAAVVGMGETGRTAIKVLRSYEPERLLLVNRTFETARELADEMGAEALSVTDLPDVLRAADVVVSATGCPFPLIKRSDVEQAVGHRTRTPLVLLDLAVPHDVEPATADLEGVLLFDVDRLEEEVSASLDARRSAIPDVEAILADEVGRFGVWFRQSRVQPLIAELRRQAESIRRQEVSRFAGDHPEMSTDVRAEVERFSQALVQKLFHHPTTRIREEATDGDAGDLAETVRALFRLGEPED